MAPVPPKIEKKKEAPKPAPVVEVKKPAPPKPVEAVEPRTSRSKGKVAPAPVIKKPEPVKPKDIPKKAAVVEEPRTTRGAKPTAVAAPEKKSVEKAVLDLTVVGKAIAAPTASSKKRDVKANEKKAATEKKDEKRHAPAAK